MFRRRRFSAARREWIGAISVTPQSVSPNNLLNNVILPQATMEEFPGAKVALITGGLFVSPATGPAAASGYGVFLGLFRRANIGGSAPLPDPELNPEFGWVWWNYCFPQIGGTGAADANASRWIGYFRIDIGQRLRLRWHEFDDLVLVVKNSNLSAAAIQFSYAFRIRIIAGRK